MLMKMFRESDLGPINGIPELLTLLKNAGINFQGIVFDTMLADYLLRPEETHNLDDMAEHYLNHRTIKIESLLGTGKKQKRMDEIFTETVAEYAGEDAFVAWRLYHVLKKMVCAGSREQVS
jgi:DNA polymerase-1